MKVNLGCSHGKEGGSGREGVGRCVRWVRAWDCVGKVGEGTGGRLKSACAREYSSGRVGACVGDVRRLCTN